MGQLIAKYVEELNKQIIENLGINKSFFLSHKDREDTITGERLTFYSIRLEKGAAVSRDQLPTYNRFMKLRSRVWIIENPERLFDRQIIRSRKLLELEKRTFINPVAIGMDGRVYIGRSMRYLEGINNCKRIIYTLELTPDLNYLVTDAEEITKEKRDW
jgi:hypothetical protein